MNRTIPVTLALLPAMLAFAQSDDATLDTRTARDQLASAVSAMDTEPERARSAFDRIADRAPNDDLRAAAIYNNAVLAKREGRADDALASFTDARSLATDPTLRRDALSNIAHLHASSAELPQDQPPTLESLDGAIEALKSAERAFLDASRTDPSHAPSVRNLQRTRQKLRELQDQRDQLEQQQSQQQQQQGDQGQQSQNADQLQQLADQQREQAQQSENAQSQEQSEQQRQERQQQQQDLSDQTQQAQEQMDESLDEQTREDMERALQAQQRAREALEQGDDEGAAQAQQEAADALEQAAQRLREQGSQGQQEQEQQQQGEGEADEQGDPRDEIDELAQRLLDKERRERERRSVYRQGGQPVRVEEDW